MKPTFHGDRENFLKNNIKIILTSSSYVQQQNCLSFFFLIKRKSLPPLKTDDKNNDTFLWYIKKRFSSSLSHAEEESKGVFFIHLLSTFRILTSLHLSWNNNKLKKETTQPQRNKRDQRKRTLQRMRLRKTMVVNSFEGVDVGEVRRRSDEDAWWF